MMNNKDFALTIYKKFSQLEGNDYIAGDYALEKILNFCESFQPKNILEVGLGIGSISDTILNYYHKKKWNIYYYGTEENDFCLKVLPKYVDFYPEIKLFNALENIPTSETFDFIIIDGSDESLSKVKEFCAPNAMIFIEGGRMSQVNELINIFPNYKYAEIISVRNTPEFGPFHQKWTGGGSLIFINPTVKQKIYCFSEKIKTYIKRRVRKIK